MTPAAYVLNRAVLKRLNQTENADNAIMQIPGWIEGSLYILSFYPE